VVFSVRHPSPPNTYCYVREENSDLTRKSIEIYLLFMCIRLCFCAWRDGFSSHCFSLSYRSFCCHIMLPIRPVKLRNQDKLLLCTSREVLLSTVSYFELYQIKKPRPIFLFTQTRCFHRIAPAPASLPPLSLPRCPHSRP
jgi:hypothetical protein